MPDPLPHPSQPAALRAEIIGACKAMGFALAGVCRAEPSSFKAELDAWLNDNRHGEMSWLKDTAHIRADIDEFLRGTKSIVMVADQYAAPGDRSGEQPASETEPTGRIARYAQGRDYHRVMTRRIHRVVDILRARYPGDSFRAFVDAAPVMEREHAARASLGWIGKNTMLIHPRLGSYLLLGGFATTLDLEPDSAHTETHHHPDYCGTCTRCIDACPTRAITERRVDATRCISYLTIEHKSPIDDALKPRIADWLLGCDICQEVCPYNAPSQTATFPPPSIHPAYASTNTPEHARLNLLDILRWTPEDRAANLTGSAIKRATLEMLQRNAAIALQNRIAP